MDHERVLDAFAAEAERLTAALDGLPEADWDRPTRCLPWRACELFAHVLVATGRVRDMLAAPPPERAEVSAAEYYRPDERFAAETNAARVDLARQEAAARPTGGALVPEFAAAWRRVHRLCREQAPGRVVRTRHGDAMLLPEFMVTRVVEVAVHGLDLAAALGRDPWLTPQAGAVVADLLTGPDGADAAALGWDQVTFVSKATGRAPLTEAEQRQAADLRVRWLTLG